MNKPRITGFRGVFVSTGQTSPIPPGQTVVFAAHEANIVEWARRIFKSMSKEARNQSQIDVYRQEEILHKTLKGSDAKTE